ncbi:MAG: hypothetical protein ACRDNE_01310 [Gaiellaceae bacterium]
MADDYILAARNKIASATRRLAALEKLRAGDESERSQIQDAYEYVISRGFSAGDQLAEAIALRAERRIRKCGSDAGMTLETARGNEYCDP